MKITVHISPKARTDLQSIKEYIATELENPTAAQATVKRILQSIRSLTEYPDMGAPLNSVMDVKSDYRFLVSGNYLTFYHREEDAVNIVRVLYGRRDYMKTLFDDKLQDS